ncbi:MAG: permease [Marmoricola sp.]
MADAGAQLDPRGDARLRAQGLVGVTVLLVALVAGLLWAKWLPYAGKTHALIGTHTWAGASPFAGHGTWAFWTTYATSVWKAALVAIVVAALLESLVPRRWLLRVLSRRTSAGQGLAAGALALPSMMCTCCTAPVAVGLRRSGAPLGASVAYWVANPLLNPAVVVFLALTLPWRYAAVRVGVGALLVLVAAVLAARLRGSAGTGSAADAAFGDLDADRAAPPWRALPGRFARTLLRYLLVLVPEYALVVLLTGWLSGRLSDFGGLGDAAGPLSLLAVGVVGALLVIPTGGEIPVIAGLLAAGAGAGVAGALLITLPAVSLPSAVMVARALGWRAVAATATIVVAGGVLAGALLAMT